MTKIKKYWVVMIALILGLFISNSVVQAETPYDITMCGSGTVTIVSASKELTVLSNESKGITISNHPNKAFDNCTYHCVGVIKIEGDKTTGTSYCKYIDPDGDILVGESIIVGTEGSWTCLQGTGKWEGIKCGGKNWPITTGKPITPGTSQGCRRATGTFELKK